jgi:hypothetical protein
MGEFAGRVEDQDGRVRNLIRGAARSGLHRKFRDASRCNFGVHRNCLGDAFQKRLFGGVNRVGSSDMHPHAVKPQTEQALLLVGAVENLGQ